jgi:2-polyprenyl-3-methyl-5-hydroxy-6-metoxy-1,4-benzoquinol methylase
MGLSERTTGELHKLVAERVTKLVPRRDAKILDVGCGTGALLVRLRTLGFQRLVGIDIDPPSNLPGIEFFQSDLDNCKTKVENGSIDLVIAVEVFEHIENIGGLLQELSRLLGPTGLILMTTPNVHSVEAKIRYLLTGCLKQFDDIGDPTHVTPIFRFPFERILKRHGFFIIDAWGHPEDGSSPTSRWGLRLLAKVGRLFGLKGEPAGDTLCMLLGRTADWEQSRSVKLKREYLTAHY